MKLLKVLQFTTGLLQVRLRVAAFVYVSVAVFLVLPSFGSDNTAFASAGKEELVICCLRFVMRLSLWTVYLLVG